jgi:hypothetical protein
MKTLSRKSHSIALEVFNKLRMSGKKRKVKLKMAMPQKLMLTESRKLSSLPKHRPSPSEVILISYIN